MQEAEVEAELAAVQACVLAAVQEAELHSMLEAAQRQLQLVVHHVELPAMVEPWAQEYSLAAVKEAVLEAVHDYGLAAVH